MLCGDVTAWQDFHCISSSHLTLIVVYFAVQSVKCHCSFEMIMLIADRVTDVCNL